MKLKQVKVDHLQYRRPGINKISFTATYEGVIRRGTIVYDVSNKQFLTHNSDLKLLAGICLALREPERVSRQGEQ